MSAAQPAAGVKAIYVSSSIGNDGNAGTTPTSPKKTIEVAFDAMTSGIECWCLLKRGDTFTDGNSLYRKMGGQSATKRHVIGAYGVPGSSGARPKLTGDLQIGIDAAPFNFLTIDAIDFLGRGPKVLGHGSDLIIQDCSMVGGPGDGLVLQAPGLPIGRLKNVRLRRILIADRHDPAGSKVQGLYVARVDGLIFEYFVVDRCNDPANIFTHNIYIQNGCTGIVVRKGAIMRPGSHGIQMRSGGTLEHCLFVQCAISSSWGGGNSPDAGGVTVDMRRNVALQGGDIVDEVNGERGWGFYGSNIKSGLVTENVWADGTGGDETSMILAGDDDGVGVLNLTVTDNIRRLWDGDPEIAGTVTGTTVTGMNNQTFPGVNLALNSFGAADLFTALRTGALTAGQVNNLVYNRLGMASVAI